MAGERLVRAYREGQIARPVFMRRLRAAGISAAAACALAAAFAPAGHAAPLPDGDGPGNSERAAARLCAKAAALKADGDGYVALVWAASRKTGTGCTQEPGLSDNDFDLDSPPMGKGVDAQHNEILVLA